MNSDITRIGLGARMSEAVCYNGIVWVAGQVGEGCYDPAAATAVVAAGMVAGEPQELAQAIAARWGVEDDNGEAP